MYEPGRWTFWTEAFSWKGSATPRVMLDVLLFGMQAGAVCTLSRLVERHYDMELGLPIGPYEIIGAALSLLLILRTNSGYDRWWEARKLWGGIVNQSRNLALSGLTFGPTDADWRDDFFRWAIAFAHTARCSLRQQPPDEKLHSLLGECACADLAKAPHMPSVAALKLGVLLKEARETERVDGWAFLQIDKERAQLIDHLGGCERILKTPLPKVYAIKIRRFIFLFLFTLPFVLLHRLENDWIIPLITMLVAYPLLSLDHIGAELQNPFSERTLSHLPLNDICNTIERNLRSYHEMAPRTALSLNLLAKNGSPLSAV